MLNSVCLVGNLGADIDLRYSQGNGQAWGTVNLAVNEKYTDNLGNKTQRTHWFRLVMFGKTAEVAANYTSKGARIGIQGKLTTREWEDQNTGQKRSTVEIIVNSLELLGGTNANGNSQGEEPSQGQYGSGNSNRQPQGQSQGQSQGQNRGQQSNRQQPPPNAQHDDYDDDIPF